jgi:3'-5' exoribonuclease
MMKNTLDQTVPGTFSPRIFPLENRMVYHRKNKAESQNQELEETE